MEIDVKELLKVATEVAKFHFRKYPDVEERIEDVKSTAWELSLTAGDKATINTLCQYAARRVMIRRQFQESKRDLLAIPSKKRASRNQFRRVAFTVTGLASQRDNPAEAAIFRIDFPVWFENLSPLKRTALKLMGVGERNEQIARILKVSESRVAQIRRELFESWIKAHA